MMTSPQPSMLTAALAAYDNGLCVIRTATDGTKKPLGQWRQYQAARPTRDEIEAWFAGGHPGMGVICGAVSGDLEMFELEGRFMDEHRDEFYDRMKTAGLELLFARLTRGYHAISPAGGRHLIYRVNGPIDGNTKLAANANHETLIETRGEGGFVVLAPSHGPVHKSGKAWTIKGGSFDSIITITVDERDALFTVARSFDENPTVTPPPPTPPTQRTPTQPWQGGAVGGSWIDTVVDHLNHTTTMLTTLERFGWQFSHTDRHGRHLVTRPGKTEGVSGSINLNGRLCPFSTSTPFETGGKPPRTFDILDVIATYEHGGDRKAAARWIADDTGIMRTWQQTQRVTVLDAAPSTVAGLDEAFWTTRPSLEHIREAARARLVAPSAVLAAVLARIAAYTPPSSCLPALVGSTSPLSLYVALRGSSGAGKSSPAAAAADLLPRRPAGCVGPLALGSGEGLVEAYMDLVEEQVDDGNGKKTKRKIKKQVHHGALFSLDEGQALAEIANRRGSTILPVLRTAWSGGDPGQANASIETRRTLAPGSYAVGLVSLWQDAAAALLLADEVGGTPQRFVWFQTDDPEAGDRGIPDWPGELDWQPPDLVRMNGVFGRRVIDVHHDIRYEIKRARINDLRGLTDTHPLDAHRRLNKLKIAGLLTILDSRHNIDLDDWALAETIMANSDTIRGNVIAAARALEQQTRRAGHDRAVERETVIETAAQQRALTKAARAVANRVWKTIGAVNKTTCKDAIASRDRALVSVDEAIAEAERLDWIVAVADGWATGKARPA